MTFVTEILEEKPAVLIVSQKDHKFVQLLKSQLNKYKAEVFFSSSLPQNLSRFEYIFLLNEDQFPKKNLVLKQKKVTLIFLNNLCLAAVAVKFYQDSVIKIVHIAGDYITQNLIDRVLWFTFSKTKESFLQLTAPKSTAPL